VIATSLLDTLTPEERAVVMRGLKRARRDPTIAAQAFRGWRPHEGQARVLRTIDPAQGKVKIAAISAGTGWGKTECLAEMHSEVGQARPGAKTLMASRSQAQADLGFKAMLTKEMGNPLSSALIERVVTSPFPTLHRKNGSYTTSRTTKDNCINLRGPEWDFITLDEAGHGDEFAYQFLLTRVRKSNGPVILWSSPQEEWFADLWHELEDRRLHGDDTVFAYRGPAMENPHLSPEFFERMKAELPLVIYEQEILGEFVASNVNTFRREHLGRIFDDSLAPSVKPISGHRYGQGWDLGVESSWAVGFVLDATAPDSMIGVHGEEHRHVVWPQVQLAMENTIRAYPGWKQIDWTGVGKVAGQNLHVSVREEEQFIFGGKSRFDIVVDTMKFIEEAAEKPLGMEGLRLPTSGPWGQLREDMRVHKLSTALRRDSKSLGVGARTWDHLDSFMLSVRAAKWGSRYAGSRMEMVA